MSKKKEPTQDSVKAESAKTTPASKNKAVKPVEAVKPAVKAAEVKPAEPAKPAPAKTVETAARPAPAKAAEPAKPAPAKVEEPAQVPVKATEKPAAAPAKAKEEKPASKGKTAAKSASKVPASEKHADSVVTVVVAKYDVGYGNNLFIRGDSAGLSWEAGVLMKNVENDVWVWTTNEAIDGAVEFKFLLNDEGWCLGENMSAPAGETTTITPTF